MNILHHRPALSSYSPADLHRMSAGDLRNNVIPIVVETEGRMERSYDIYSRLLKDRIVFIGSEIDPYNQVANAVIAQFLFLQMAEKEAHEQLVLLLQVLHLLMFKKMQHLLLMLLHLWTEQVLEKKLKH